jgi:two-component system nitrate/nitrite response regulator NarL
MGANSALEKATAPVTASERRLCGLIVSEVRFLRECLTEALRRERTALISWLSVDVDAALLRTLDELQPDFVLLDATIPDGSGVVGRIRDVAPGALVIVFAVAETEEHIVAWAEAGVAGYIPKTAAFSDVVPLLGDIIRGEQSCSGRVAAALMRRVAGIAHFGAGRSNISSPPTLTARELQVIRLIGAGLSNKDIARNLNIGLATTKSHVHNLLAKLHLQRRSQAALWLRGYPASTQPVAVSSGAAGPE